MLFTYWPKNNTVNYVNYFNLQTNHIKKSLHLVLLNFINGNECCQIIALKNDCWLVGSVEKVTFEEN